MLLLGVFVFFAILVFRPMIALALLLALGLSVGLLTFVANVLL